MTKHKHYDTIMAWANGEAIEASTDRANWFEVIYPEWHKGQLYRVRPTPKPDTVHEVSLSLSAYAGPLLHPASALDANCVLVFDGETNKLKECTFKGA